MDCFFVARVLDDMKKIEIDSEDPYQLKVRSRCVIIAGTKFEHRFEVA